MPNTDNSVDEVPGAKLSAPVYQDKAPTVNIAIKKQAGSYTSDQTPISPQEGDTAFSVLVRAGQEHDIPVVFSGTKKTACIKGINNPFEFDSGPQSGWIFKVNGIQSDQSSGVYIVSANDEIGWIFVDSFKEGVTIYEYS